jgi:hypothetical protein
MRRFWVLSVVLMISLVSCAIALARYDGGGYIDEFQVLSPRDASGAIQDTGIVEKVATASPSVSGADDGEGDCLVHVPPNGSGEYDWMYCEDESRSDGYDEALHGDIVEAWLSDADEQTKLDTLSAMSVYYVEQSATLTNQNGSRLQIVTGHAPVCSDGSQYWLSPYPSGFQGTITSVATQGVGCSSTTLYSLSGYTGASLDCGMSCSDLAIQNFDNMAMSQKTK